MSWWSEMATASELMTEYMSNMDPMIALVKKVSEASPDFPPMEGFLENIKDFVKKSKTYVDGKNEEFGEKWRTLNRNWEKWRNESNSSRSNKLNSNFYVN